jgi:hypothetical protein
MRKIYTTVLITQYAIWGVYIASLVGIYLLGFIVDTLNIRWVLIPATLIVVALSIVLSLAVCVMFILRQVRGEIQSNHWLGLPSALPSIFVVGAALFYILGGIFKG